jgi:hypothetical protein
MALSLQSLIGHRVGVPGSLTYTDEQEIQYISGRSLVRVDLESRIEKVFPGANEAVSGFTAVAITPNRKTSAHAEFVAGSNGAEGYPVVSIYEWPKTTSGSKKKRVGNITIYIEFGLVNNILTDLTIPSNNFLSYSL